MKKFELSIPKPCHENWEAMTTEAKGRFCGSCQKTVMDFTAMSDREIAQFFKKPAGSVCGRFAGDQLDRVIEVPRKRIPWVKYFFTIALPAFLFAKKATAQAQVKEKEKIVCTPLRLGMVRQKPLEQVQKDTVKTVTGRVTDEKGNPLSYVSVQALNTTWGTQTDSLGNFSLSVTPNVALLQISLVGFDAVQVAYRGEALLSVILPENKNLVMGEMIVVATKKKKAVPLIQPVKSTTFSKFSAYPNPVYSNSILTIEPKTMKEGRYDLSVLTSGGQVVQTIEVMIEKKQQKIDLQLGTLKAGSYFITLTDKKTGKNYTELFIVQ